MKIGSTFVIFIALIPAHGPGTMACHAPSGNARDAVLSLKIIVNTVSYVESAELCFESHSTLTEKSLVNSKKNSEAAMNHSLYGADRRTHLKIVIIGLLCAIVV